MYSFQPAVLILKINVFIDVFHHIYIYIYIYICTHTHTNMISTHIELLEAEEMISAVKPEMINTIYTMIAPSKIITVTMIIIRVPLTPHFFCQLSKNSFLPDHVAIKIYLLLTEGKGCTGEYWPEVVTNNRGPIFPGTARASSVSKQFIMWNSVPDSKMHFRWLALKKCSSSSIFEIFPKFQSF